MRHDCRFCGGIGHDKTYGESGRPTYGSCKGKARRRAANKNARRARKAS